MITLFHDQLLDANCSAHKVCNQVIIFVAGLSVSLFFAFTFIDHIYLDTSIVYYFTGFYIPFEGLMWFMVGMVVPLLPSIIGLEGLR